MSNSMVFLKKKDLCDRYRISLPTLDSWIRKNLLPAPLRNSKILRWRLADLEAFEEQQAARAANRSDDQKATRKGPGR